MTDDTRQNSTGPAWWKDESRHFHEETDAAMEAIGIDGNEGSTQAIRGDLVTAREEIRRAIAGDDADLATAAGLIDLALQGLCPHDRAGWLQTTAGGGERLITCTQCTVSWYTGERGPRKS
jgi:hypothetical protein